MHFYTLNKTAMLATGIVAEILFWALPPSAQKRLERKARCRKRNT